MIFILWHKLSRPTGRFTYSCICQGTSTRRQRSDFFGLRVSSEAATCYYQSN